MKMNENLHGISDGLADSLFNNTGKTTKETVRLDRGQAEKAVSRLLSGPPGSRALPKKGNRMGTERVRRGPLERMFKIHQMIADGKCVNAMQLAAELEVGHKTICRDIEYMRDHYRLPIEFDRTRHGYFYSQRVDGFPGAPTVTEREVFAWLVANKAIEQYRGTPFHPLLQTSFEKMLEQLDSKDRFSVEDFAEALSFRPFAPEDTDLRLFELVTRARRERRVLEFVYRKPGAKEASARKVHPYHLTCCDNRWYLLAFDEGRSDVRTFALGRMEQPVICDDRFTRPRDFDPVKYLRGSFTVMKGEGDYEVVIEFDAWATDLLRGRQWHSSQQITELPSGGSRMRMRLSGLEEVERWVLSWGIHSHVVTPAPLAERIRRTIEELAERYPVEQRLNA